MTVGFTEKLDEKSGDAIAADEGPKDCAGWRCPAIDACEQKEESKAFQAGFIELRRVPAFRPTLWKDHTPLDIGGSPK